LPLDPQREVDEEEPLGRVEAPETPSVPSGDEGPADHVAADFGLRLQGGLADLAFVALVGAVVTVGVSLAGATLTTRALAGVLLFVLDFSFLYMLLPLAFWGRTPGMAWAGVRLVADDGGLPTFRRCAVRWIVAVLTVASLGLLALVALIGRRSLADRLSRSRLILAD
jgi:uncharacterized RDD family membrane protein YckC